DDLRAACSSSGKTHYFVAFERYDLESDADRPTYAAIAKELGVAATDVTNYLSAARRMYRAFLLERLRAVCGDSAEFETEARHLRRGGLRCRGAPTPSSSACATWPPGPSPGAIATRSSSRWRAAGWARCIGPAIGSSIATSP